MKILLAALQYFYCAYAILLFLAGMFLILPFVFITSFFQTTSGNIIYYFLKIWGWIWFPLAGIFQKKIFEVHLEKNEPVIYVCNHSSYIDAAVIINAIPLPFRPLGKAEMARVPLFGFIYKHAAIMVNRASAKDRAQSVQQLHEMLQKKISVLIFPEGTINKTGKPLKKFYDGAFSMAIKNRVAIQPVIFPDNEARMRGGLFSLTPGKARIIFPEKIMADNYSLRDLNLLKQKVYQSMEAAIIKYRR